MSVTSGFFNSLNGDRKYNAQQMSALFDGLINDGIFATIGTAFEVLATTGMAFSVGIGRAWFNHVWVYNDAILPMSLSDSEMILERIDAVVIEINNEESVRAGQILVVQGTPASQATRPTLTNTEAVHQYPLAYIHVRAGAESITQADITNMVGSDPCPYVTGLLEVRDIENIVSQWEAQFVQWMDGLGDILEGDVAANMANRILELESQFKDLARDKSLYDTIEDDDGYTIKDSNGFEIEGRISFAGNFASEGSGSGSEEEEPDVPSYTGDGFQVGDILTTVRNNLGPKWLLCNGQTVDRDQYPTLAGIYSFNPNEVFTENDKIFENSTSAILTHAIRANGYYVVLGKYTSGSTSKVAIAYSQSLNGPWTEKVLCNVGDSESDFAGRTYGLVYGNGFYAALVNTGVYASEATDELSIFYSPTLDGSWTEVGKGGDRHDSGTGSVTWSYPTSFNFINGYFFITYYYYNNYGSSSYVPTFQYATSPNGPWTSKSIFTTSGYPTTGVTLDITFHDGEYIALIYPTHQSSPVQHCSSLTGTWAGAGRVLNFTHPHILRYVNSTWVLAGFHTTEKSSTGVDEYVAKIAYTSEIAGEWTVVEIPNITYVDSSEVEWEVTFYPFDIVYHKGFYLILAGGCYNHNEQSGQEKPIYLLYANTLNGPWMTRYLFHLGLHTAGDNGSYYGQPSSLYWDGGWNSGKYNIYTPRLVLLENGELVIVSRELRYLDTSKITLPSISLGSAFSYIKVEE